MGRGPPRSSKNHRDFLRPLIYFVPSGWNLGQDAQFIESETGAMPKNVNTCLWMISLILVSSLGQR
uniref:Uncharacterized protein n=1 Tax=Rhizophagus irregularis (strain DAOM 181602 / DAOM 197198 / MUCL 43194) TaxID=747089 RepID=U9T1X4_RHIID